MNKTINSLIYKGMPIDFTNRENWVAIVGSRNATQKELNQAYYLAKRLVAAGKIVVSGLAKGIDTAAHQGAVDAGGKTIAIVNTPSTQDIYPKENRKLADDILQCGGIIYPYKDAAKEMNAGEKGMSQFSKRLIERDLLLADLCSVIVTVKDGESPITGGTKWAFNRGGELSKRLFRMDTNQKFYEFPSYEKRKIYWDMELNVEEIIQELYGVSC